MNDKPWYKSKTIWWNIATGAAQVLQGLSDTHILGPQAGLIINLVGNLVLRFLTNQPISLTAPPLNR